jgi:tetratricopeptide (TPR) repeat protein
MVTQLGIDEVRELIVRFFPIAAGAALILTSVSSAAFAEKPLPVIIDPVAVDLMAQAAKLSKSGDTSTAEALLETALAVDPRAAAAYIALADIAQKTGLSGKAIGYYDDALELQPDNRMALAGQGIVYAQRGAIAKATENRDRLRSVCRRGCAALSQVQRAIKAGPVAEVKSVEAIMPKPAITEIPPAKP